MKLGEDSQLSLTSQENQQSMLRKMSLIAYNIKEVRGAIQ